MANFTLQVASLLLQRRGIEVEIDEHQPAKDFHLNRLQREFAALEIDHPVGIACRFELAVEAVGPGVVRTGNGTHPATAEE